MRRVSIIWLVGIIGLLGCRKELERLEQPAWAPELGVPLFYARMSSTDLAYDWARAEEVVTDSLQRITLIYRSPGAWVSVVDMLGLPRSHAFSITNQRHLLPQEEYSEWRSLGQLAQAMPPTLQAQIANAHGSVATLPPYTGPLGETALALWDGLVQATFKQAILQIELTNQLPYRVQEMDLQLEDAMGQVVAGPVNVQNIVAGQTRFITMTISNRTVRFPLRLRITNAILQPFTTTIDTAHQGLQIRVYVIRAETQLLQGRFSNVIIGDTLLWTWAENIHQVWFKAGQLRVRVEPTFSHVSLKVTFLNAVLRQAPVVVEVPPSGEAVVSLANTQWDMRNMFVLIQAHGLADNARLATDPFALTLSFEGVQIANALAAPNPDVATQLTDTLWIPLFRHTQSGTIRFKEPQLRLAYHNATPWPLEFQDPQIAGLTRLNSTEMLLYPGSVGPILLNSATQGAPVVFYQPIDASNSNLPTLLAKPVVALVHHVQWEADTNQPMPIWEDAYLGTQMELKLPFEGRVDALIFRDTFGVNTEVLDQIEQVDLIMTLTNYFPLRVDAVLLVPWNGRLDTFATATIPAFQEGQTRVVVEVQVSQDVLEELKQTKRLVLHARFHSLPEEQNVVITSEQYFTIHVGAKARYTLVGGGS